MAQKRGKVFTWPVWALPVLKAKGILLRAGRKCELSAKVRLTGERGRHRESYTVIPDTL
jgi:hypothetical protein